MTVIDPLAHLDSVVLACAVIGCGLLNSIYKETAHWALLLSVLFAMIGTINPSREGILDLQTAIPFFLGMTIGIVARACVFHAARRAALYVLKMFTGQTSQ